MTPRVRTCPDCGDPAVAVIEVASIGTGGPEAVHGWACPVRQGGHGSGWRLYIHQDLDAIPTEALEAAGDHAVATDGGRPDSVEADFVFELRCMEHADGYAVTEQGVDAIGTGATVYGAMHNYVDRARALVEEHEQPELRTDGSVTKPEYCELKEVAAEFYLQTDLTQAKIADVLGKSQGWVSLAVAQAQGDSGQSSEDVQTDGGIQSEESEWSRHITTEQGVDDLLTDLDVGLHNMWIDVRERHPDFSGYQSVLVEVTISVTGSSVQTDGGHEDVEHHPDGFRSGASMLADSTPIHRQEPDPADPANWCYECGTEALAHCGVCGRPLCGRHHKTQAGMCSNYTTVETEHGPVPACIRRGHDDEWDIAVDAPAYNYERLDQDDLPPDELRAAVAAEVPGQLLAEAADAVQDALDRAAEDLDAAIVRRIGMIDDALAFARASETRDRRDGWVTVAYDGIAALGDELADEGRDRAFATWTDLHMAEQLLEQCGAHWSGRDGK